MRRTRNQQEADPGRAKRRVPRGEESQPRSGGRQSEERSYKRRGENYAREQEEFRAHQTYDKHHQAYEKRVRFLEAEVSWLKKDLNTNKKEANVRSVRQDCNDSMDRFIVKHKRKIQEGAVESRIKENRWNDRMDSLERIIKDEVLDDQVKD